ncbi:AAA family ATPase [Evansella tamaricis]|uniref:AAA family ATPase n=1 Tax=Evansella tamaricis TaxID=2069301 RepID=A0ABS6JCF5_9BACI|nr:AAA family ATPase [Evansella tamaricis]MBU9711105.1 AAA family ATPase [Evansella tamaricis]
MKRLELISLKLKNFKGIKSFVLDANGDTEVLGDNGTGKSTLFDAENWLLFDKDSQNKKEFAIKTLDFKGNEIHNLDHEVEGTFRLENKEINLRKVYREKWTRKRGSATQEFDGHTVDYFIDGVPVKKKEYTDKVSQIIDEGVFKLLTSPTYFNEHLKWQERRNILLKVCGDISEEDVIASNKKLGELTKILGDRSIEDHKLVIAAKKKDINKELEMIPVRIDEINHNLPDINGINVKEIKNKIAKTKDLIENKEDQISRIRNGGEFAELQKKLREVEGQLLDIKNKHNAENQDKVSAKQSLFYEIKNAISQTEHQISNQQRRIRSNEEDIKVFDGKRDRLRNQYFEVEKREHSIVLPEHDENCSTCGQALPQEEIEQAHQRAKEQYEAAVAQFNLNKSKELEEIKKQGHSLKAQSEEREKDSKEANEAIAKLEETLKQQEVDINQVQSDIESLKANTTSINDNEEYVAKFKESQQLEQQIKEVQANVQSSIDGAQSEITDLRGQIKEYELDLAKVDQHKQSEKRVQELEDRQKELAAEYAELEKELFLAEEFIRAKVNLLEEKINSKFQYARFKLFETQINGGLNEVCETTFDGVPYGSGLNNAARINVGLDIINTLSEHYEFAAPIFIDNAEAVTKLIDTKAQTIALIVSEKDKSLRVESKSKEAVLV